MERQAHIPKPPPDRRRRRSLRVVLVAMILILLSAVICLIVVRCRPRADPDGPYTCSEALPCQFDGSQSTRADLVYTWDFGDGSTGSGVRPTHVYSDGCATCVFTVTLTVTDRPGQTDSTTTKAKVENRPPTAVAGGPYTCTVGETITLQGECNDPSPVDDAVLQCTWADFHGAAISTPTFQCPQTVGQVTVTLTATDKDGASAQDTATITVEAKPNLSPIAVIRYELLGKTGVRFRFDGSGSTDPDGTIVSYHWDFGDGTTSEEPIIIHTYAEYGRHVITLTVTDNEGATGQATITLQ